MYTNHATAGNPAIKNHDFLSATLEPRPYVDLASLRRTRVLLVEDDRTTRRLVSKAIGDYCDLVEAFNAGGAATKYQKLAPDIVFLDLELPDHNGHHLLQWIKRNDPGAYVVLFSGNCDRFNIRKAMNNGAQGYIAKPFDSNLMMRHICQCPKLH